MGSKSTQGFSTFGGAEGTPSDKSRVDVKVTKPLSSGDTNTVQPNNTNDGVGVGVQDGLSMLEPFKAVSEVGPTYNYSQDPMTGNYQERPNPYTQDKSVSGKGKSFEIDA